MSHLVIKRPFISLVIPVYNTEKYLQECLSSLESMFFESVEVIAVDDGSTDGSLGLLSKFEEENANFKVVKQSNMGVSAARNAGIKRAVGEYIFFLDSDDILVPGFLGAVIDFLVDNSELDLVNLKFRRFYDSQHSFEADDEGFSWELNGKRYLGSQLLESYLSGRIAPAPYTYIVRREYLISQNLFFKDGMYYQDAHYFALLLYAGGLVGFLDVPSVFYRVRDNSITTSFSHAHIESIFILLNDLYDRLHVDRSSRRFFRYFLGFYFWQVNRNVRSRLNSFDAESYRYLIRLLGRSLRKIGLSSMTVAVTDFGVKNCKELYGSLKKMEKEYCLKDENFFQAEKVLLSICNGKKAGFLDATIFSLRVRVLSPFFAGIIFRAKSYSKR